MTTAMREHGQERATGGDDEQGDSGGTAAALYGVTKHYGRHRGRVTALADITVEFPRSSLTAVMGLSGSGKSTLLQVASGLDRPSAGSVRLGGTELGQLSKRKLSVLRRERVGFVFQALNLMPSLSVAENIALPLRLGRRRVDRAEIAALAALVGLAGQLRRLPGTLSGGQQQRVAIARALVTSPEVIFADEPTAALDPCTSEAVVGLLRRAVDALHQTVVVVTHEPAVAARADRAVLLDRGRLAEVIDRPGAAELGSALRRLAEAAR
ncbi:MAG TPA: ABC transporter ATP-binding protein [Streptosporangiaceae bacterium]|jgi:putative ABC transport system ATP-binding protein